MLVAGFGEHTAVSKSWGENQNQSREAVCFRDADMGLNHDAYLIGLEQFGFLDSLLLMSWGHQKTITSWSQGADDTQAQGSPNFSA